MITTKVSEVEVADTETEEVLYVTVVADGTVDVTAHFDDESVTINAPLALWKAAAKAMNHLAEDLN